MPVRSARPARRVMSVRRDLLAQPALLVRKAHRVMSVRRELLAQPALLVRTVMSDRRAIRAYKV